MSLDPIVSNPNLYRVVFENERVRVLEYADIPGEKSTPHVHPDSVMVTLSSFRRRLASGGRERDLELPSGVAVWLPSQSHTGENIGDTETHTILVELKEPQPNLPGHPSGVADGTKAAEGSEAGEQKHGETGAGTGAKEAAGAEEGSGFRDLNDTQPLGPD